MWWIALALVLLSLVYVRPKLVWAVLGCALILLSAVLIHNRQQGALRAGVVVEAAYAPALCPRERPLKVSISNRSEAVLERVAFTLQAAMPGYSTVITPYTYRQNTSEKILRPGESYADCYSLPLLTSDPTAEYSLDALEWSVEVHRTTFQ